MAEGQKKEGVEFIKWFSELSSKDIKIAGGKGASLAEMYNTDMPIPPGFVVTADAYQYFIEHSSLSENMQKILDSFDIEDTEALEKGTKEIRELINGAEIPDEMKEAIVEAYEILDVDKKDLKKAKGGALDILKTGHEPPFVAVRSSATAEDLADASFAGQQDSFLNVKGDQDLLEKVKACFASLYTARATYYREKKGFEHLETHLAVVVQKMVDSEKSGVMFSTNPVKTDGSILIEAVWGLGEGIVSGRIKPDQYIVSPDLENFEILEITVSEKKEAIVRDSSGKNIIVKLTEDKAKQQVLTSYEVKRLAQFGKKLEEHYEKPQDVEFAIEKERLFIVQSRPVTTKAKETTVGEITGEILLSGMGASPGVGSGVVKIVGGLEDLSKIKKGDILVTKMTNPDMVVTMQKAAGIVTDEGGLTSHASIVSREMGIPAVVGTGEATSKLKDGSVVTVDGNAGKVFEGRGEAKAVEILPVVETKTKIKVIVDLPDFAERAAKSRAKGVGLTRIEGIIAGSGKHPAAFVKEKNMDPYIQILKDGLRKIAMPFEELWIRTSDIRTDEYRHLEGAPKEVEGNPMLGDHGIRFGLRHPEILESEMKAIKELADESPQKKFGFMFPQIISVEEVREAKRIANEIGMSKNIKIGVMVETPASVQIIDKLCDEGIDFISFGTNDLTQYTLAIDRNNADVQYLYDETSPAVLSSLAHVIRVCREKGVETSICGQAGSRPEMVRFLVAAGINSISVNADAAHKISKLVAELESSGGGPAGGGGIVPAKEEKAEEKPRETQSEQVIPHNRQAIISDEDVESVILSQLEDRQEPKPEPEPEPNRPDEYMPGPTDREDKDVPPLNDAIPVDSDLIEEADKDDEKEVDLSHESEWAGEENQEDETEADKEDEGAGEKADNGEEKGEEESEGEEVYKDEDYKEEDEALDIF